MRTSFDNITTTDLCKRLNNILPDEFLSDIAYEMIKEISFRQALRMKLPLEYKEIVDLAHNTSTDIVIYLDRVYKTGFRVTNWIRFIYNKTMKHYMALFDSHGNIRPQIVEFNDYTDFLTYRNSVHISAYTWLKEIQELEVRDYIKSCGRYLEPFISANIIYKPTHPSYTNVKNSIICSVLTGHLITLYGLSERDKEYVISLYRWTKKEFPKFFRKCIFNDFTPDIVDMECYYEE